MALSQSSVMRLYSHVIEETIQSSRDAFVDEGVDEQVLLELKQLWQLKINSSKAIEIDPPLDSIDGMASTSTKRHPVKRNQNEVAANSNNLYQQNNQAGTSQIKQHSVTNGNAPVPLPGTIPSQPQQIPQQAPQIPQQPPPQQIPMFSNMLDPTKVVPIQITLPPQAGVQESRVLSIQVPATALIGNQLPQVLTGPVISATMGLPLAQASSLLQQHVNAALQGQSSPLLAKSIPQVDGVTSSPEKVSYEISDIFQLHRALKNSKKRLHRKKLKVPQVDGSDSVTGLLEDSSEDDDDASDEPSEEEDLDDDKEDEDQDIDEGGMEEEPLNSEDDVSEEDPTDLFDTENVVVCQYDKINRSRNRWKFYLKDGIMNLNGKDYVFQKTTGDAEW